MTETFVLIASGLWACAAGLVGFYLVSVAAAPRLDHLLPNQSERDRRAKLRASNSLYRWFEPMVDSMAAWNLSVSPGRMETLQQNFSLVEPLRWSAAEFVAVKQLEAIALAVGTTLFFGILFGSIGSLFAGVLAMIIYLELGLKQISRRAELCKKRFKTRLPYVLDLMSLMLESGADVRQCFEAVSRENRGHPAGDEFARVLSATDQGMTRAQALKELAARMNDTDISELVSAINTAEDLGTPLHQVLRSLADQMRLRRVQIMEREAEEAKVHVTWPAMLVMLACLIIVAAPFVLAGMQK